MKTKSTSKKKSSTKSKSNGSAASKGLAAKAKSSGYSLSKLRSVYKRGMAAWKSGHRPGVTQQQWAMGRVNSFITGKGGARKADSDLLKGKKKKSSKSKSKSKKK